MSLFGGGLVGGMLSTVAGAALDSFMTEDQVKVQPIPTFYFAVELFDGDAASYVAPEVVIPGGADTSFGGNLLAAAKGMVATSNTLSFDPTENWHEKAFIDISGIEMGTETEQKQMGGYNYPLDLPGKMKNPHVMLKRLFRPINTDDVWSKWIDETIKAMSMWKTAIKTQIMTITLYHPNLNTDGDPYILWVGTFYDAYPVKHSFGTFSSTGEDLMTQEIEIAYSNMEGVSP